MRSRSLQSKLLVFLIVGAFAGSRDYIGVKVKERNTIALTAAAVTLEDPTSKAKL